MITIFVHVFIVTFILAVICGIGVICLAYFAASLVERRPVKAMGYLLAFALCLCTIVSTCVAHDTLDDDSAPVIQEQ